MKIFLQSESPEALRWAADAGFLDGVVLSLIELADQSPDVDVADRVADLSREFALPIMVPVAALMGGDIYREARDLARISDHVIVQIPFVEDAVTPIRRLVADGVRVCATYIYSGVQAFLSAKVGATMVMSHVDDIDAHGQDSARLVSEVQGVIKQAELECDQIVSLPRSSMHFTECLLAGADAVCTTPDMVRTFMLNALTDRGVDRFLSTLSKRHKPRGI